MCWYTDFLFVIFIKYDFKYLLSNIYFNINHYENKIGYYKHIYFYIIHHENKLGYYKHRIFFFIKLHENKLKIL
jgi:hypothetical protein